MTSGDRSTGERAIKEYPNTTRWLEGRRILGVGNLILTTERLVFLNQVVPTERQVAKLKELTDAPTSRVLNFALGMHKSNFEIPLAALTSVKLGTFLLLPFPRFCLKLTYEDAKSKSLKQASFMFTIPLLRGFFQLEITTVQSWVWLIKRTMRHKGLTI